MTTDAKLADTQRAIIESAERRGYERALAEREADARGAATSAQGAMAQSTRPPARPRPGGREVTDLIERLQRLISDRCGNGPSGPNYDPVLLDVLSEAADALEAARGVVEVDESVIARLKEAYDFGQFSDDFNQPLARLIRKDIRSLLRTLTATQQQETTNG